MTHSHAGTHPTAILHCHQRVLSTRACPSPRLTASKFRKTTRWQKPRIAVTTLQTASEDLKADPENADALTLTERMFDRAARQAAASQAGGAGGSTTYAALKGADAAWAKAKAMQEGHPSGPRPTFVKTLSTRLSKPAQYDVIMCGGTLGVFLACALQLNGLKVVVVERGPLQGRQQEWNISRKELQELVHEKLLSSAEAEECISIEFNPNRAGFHGSEEVWTQDVLNLGIRPDKIIAKVRQKFESAGGVVMEKTPAEGVSIHPNGVALQLQQPDQSVTGQLLIDCMGNFSPIVRQVRWGEKPDGVCMVVGSCCRGFHNNTTSDVICTTSDIQPHDSALPDLQCFWEAFPSGSGPSDRTTYMFTYVDALPQRPSLQTMMEEYWKRMPEYQQIQLENVEPLRILFGWFPTYRKSPLSTPYDRVLQIGDASGIQSPLSFGGFGALTRHLARLRQAVMEAIQISALDQKALAAINCYNPGLSAAWMFQRSMSIRPGQKTPRNFVNRLLGVNFKSMSKAGDWVLKPFMQDVVQFLPLARTLLGQLTTDPLVIPMIFKHVGVLPIFGWVRHFLTLALYTVVSKVRGLAQHAPKAATDRQQYFRNRKAESLKYGSGFDYVL